MTAHASLATERNGQRRDGAVSRLHVLRSHSPLVLRPTRPKGAEPLVRGESGVARVSLAAGAAGPLGGDAFALDVRVGAGSTLVLSEISATLLLPGARGGRSSMRITIDVEDGATFVWIPEPLIIARGCDHVHTISVRLHPHARLLMRDELLLGRHREGPGVFTQQVAIQRGACALYRQRLDIGPTVRGADSPAVVGAHKCVGTVVVVDPQRVAGPPEAQVIGPASAMLPLAGPAIAISALAGDTSSLRALLDEGVALLGDPWSPHPAPTSPTAAGPTAANAAAPASASPPADSAGRAGASPPATGDAIRIRAQQPAPTRG